MQANIGVTRMLDKTRQVSVFHIFENDGSITKLIRFVDEEGVMRQVVISQEAMDALIQMNEQLEVAAAMYQRSM